MTVPKRFGVLRLIGTLLKILAWIVLVVSVLAAIGLGIAGGALTQLLGDSLPGGAALAGVGSGIVAGIAALIFGLIYFLALYAVGESLHMQLAIEENTRLTAALLLRMHQESQPDNRPNYAPGFASEPFERG
jgi:hypothetical protein